MMGGGVLAKNALWNLAGLAAPMGVAILCIPAIVNKLGVEKFGVLNLAWMVIGYFTLFDLGLGRALTKLVAEKLGHERQDDLPSLVWTASLLMLALGALGGIVLGLLTPYLVDHIFKVPAGIRQETTRTFYLLAAAIPLVISSTGLRGILEAYQRFDLSSAIRISMGTFMFLGPMLVLPFSRNLFWIAFVLVTGRIVTWGLYLFFCIRILPGLRANISPKRDMVRPLLAFGGWMTVSNIVGPMMAYLDRFLIGVLISMAAVAYYSTPWEVVTKFLVIPGAVVGVLFPAFSTAAVRDPARAAGLYRRSVKYVFLALFPLSLLTVSFAKEGMHLWLGAEFAENGYRVMQFLSIGVLLNGLACVPFAFIQGVGRPDVTAKIHMCELLIYVPCAYWLVWRYGATGAALSWMLRASVDALLMFAGGMRFAAAGPVRRSRLLFAGIPAFVAALFAMMLPWAFVPKVVVTVAALAICGILTWFTGMDANEKEYIHGKLGRFVRHSTG
jgi:O-antigen/teichoic acid export membrane protein